MSASTWLLPRPTLISTGPPMASAPGSFANSPAFRMPAVSAVSGIVTRKKTAKFTNISNLVIQGLKFGGLGVSP